VFCGNPANEPARQLILDVRRKKRLAMDDDIEDVDSQRCVAAMIPAASSFSLESAVLHFQDSRFGRKRLVAELAPPGSRRPKGFRVNYGNWGVVAWMNKGALTDADHANKAKSKPLPVPADVLASCDRLLTVWADPDPDAKYTKQWVHYLEQLQSAFGLVIWDYDNDKWWVAERRTNG
jgi:hypothetical protein